MIMETDRKWIIVRIDGKIASISTDYRQLAAITAKLALSTSADTKAYKGIAAATQKICADTVSFEEVWNLRQTARWDDLMLFGTDFQKRVWKKLWELTHPGEAKAEAPGQAGTEIPGQAGNDGGYSAELVSYTAFAELCENKAGVRAVAHAIGLNPVAVVIPCHLVVPKETIDRIHEIQKKAESTIFKGDDLCISSLLREKGIDFGEYALGRKIKRKLIQLEHSTGEL